MSNLPKNEFLETTVYNLAVKPKTQSKLLRFQSFENAINNLGHRLLTNLTDLAILKHKKHLNQIQLNSKTKQLKYYKNRLHQLLKRD